MCMLRILRTCNTIVRFSDYYSKKKLLDGVTLLSLSLYIYSVTKPQNYTLVSTNTNIAFNTKFTPLPPTTSLLMFLPDLDKK